MNYKFQFRSSRQDYVDIIFQEVLLKFRANLDRTLYIKCLEELKFKEIVILTLSIGTNFTIERNIILIG